MAILIADTGLVVYSIVSLLFFFALAGKYDRQIVKSAVALSPPQAVREVSVQDLEILNSNYLVNSSGKTDFISLVSNPNSDWWAKITYHFNLSGESSDSEEIKILPGQSLYLILAGQSITPTSNTDQAELVLENISWQRILDRVKLNNFQFDVSDVVYESNVVVPNSSQTFSRVTGQISNRSLFGYWSVDIQIILLKGNQPVALKQILLRQFIAGETQSINAQWFDALPSPLEIIVQPVVDIFDDSNYMNLR